ncbi:MAG: hypothetical protein QME81_08720 [bacterium]|nr:hypothetical protein [bacterium]
MEHSPQETACQILRYLARHPQAKDGLEGIARWWILQERIDVGVDEVQEAISFLVAQGFIIESKLTGQESCYQLNPAKKEEIAGILNAPAIAGADSEQ